MLESKNYVPLVYRNSRDYQAILKLFDLIINAIKSDIDNFVSLINPDRCPDHMLPLLASYVGYDYDTKESIEANRLIIKYYPYLIHNRGSETGITLATALSVNAIGSVEDIESLSMFHIEYQKENNKINIYIYYPNYLSKIRDLIEVVRPAGVRVELIPANPINTIDKIEVHDYIKNSREPYSQDRYNVSGKDKVGFSEIAKNKNRINYERWRIRI